jgi:hypothetical protein
VAIDFDADRCVVKTPSLTLNPVSGIRRYDSLEVGEAVLAVGNPQSVSYKAFRHAAISSRRPQVSGRKKWVRSGVKKSNAIADQVAFWQS